MRAEASTLAASPSRLGVFLELTKPRITALVLVTAAVGYAVGAGRGLDPLAFIALLAGTAMVAGGASALNQYSEREADARMERTRRRPLPSGRVAPAEALAFGLAVSIGGMIVLATINPLTALLGAIALTSYTSLHAPSDTSPPSWRLPGRSALDGVGRGSGFLSVERGRSSGSVLLAASALPRDRLDAPGMAPGGFPMLTVRSGRRLDRAADDAYPPPWCRSRCGPARRSAGRISLCALALGSCSSPARPGSLQRSLARRGCSSWSRSSISRSCWA
jgi:hypothetical protein